MSKHHSFTLIEDITIANHSRTEFEKIHASTKGDVRMHLTDMLVATTRGDEKCRMTLVYNGDDLVGASVYRTKNDNTLQSTTVLYNLFSIMPGAGSAAFQSYWKYAHTNSKWYKFFVFKRAHAFYQKYNVPYWGASKTGQTFSALGKIYNSNVNDSMAVWKDVIKNDSIEANDRIYLEKNLQVFADKHTHGIAKLKGVDLDNLNEAMLKYTTKKIELDLF